MVDISSALYIEDKLKPKVDMALLNNEWFDLKILYLTILKRGLLR